MDDVRKHVETRPGGAGTPASHQINRKSETAPITRQVSWFETFSFATKIAAEHGVVLDHRALPVAGTLQWCGLADDDARKLLALVLGGVRDALANDARQQAVHDAGEAVWEGEDWSDAARQLLRRREIDELRKAS